MARNLNKPKSFTSPMPHDCDTQDESSDCGNTQMKRARYSSAGEFSQSVQTASSTSVNDGRAVLESGSLNKSPLKMSTASLGEATKGGEKDEVQVSFPDQCTPTTEDQISPTGTLLRPHQFLEEMNHKHPGHTRSGHGYRAGNSFSSNAKK